MDQNIIEDSELLYRAVRYIDLDDAALNGFLSGKPSAALFMLRPCN